MGADSKDSRNPFERFLGLFADVRGGEGTTLVLLAMDVCLLLMAYYIIKPVREALIIAGGGAEVKAYASAGQAMLLLGAVPLYSAIASRSSRRRLINVVTIFFAACLGAFYILAQFQVPLGVVFYLWVGVFNLMIIAQFWAFANDLYTPEAGKRLFAVVAIGGSVGATLGGKIAKLLAEPMGAYQLLFVAAGLLLVSLIIANVIDSRERHGAAERAAARAEEAEEPIGKSGAFRLVFKSKYLILIALLMLFLNCVNTTGEYILSRTVQNAAETSVAASETQTADGAVKLSEEDRKDQIQKYVIKFYGDFFSVVNLVALLAQLFVVSRILKYLGVRVALLILPVIALGAYALLIFYPILGIVRWAKTAENSTDYSLQNTVRQVLFLPTTREQKYKAKQAIDTFFVRAGDLCQAGLVFAGTTWFAFKTMHFALVNLVLVAIWIVIAILIGRENRILTAESE